MDVPDEFIPYRAYSVGARKATRVCSKRPLYVIRCLFTYLKHTWPILHPVTLQSEGDERPGSVAHIPRGTVFISQ